MPTLTDRIRHRDVVVAVFGQGYVGLTAALATACAGMPVVGVDTDAALIRALGDGRLVVPGVPQALFDRGISTGLVTFTTDAAGAAAADVVLVCVPTPVAGHVPDLQAVEAAGRSIAEHVTRGALVVLESTTYPGTTEQVLQPLLEAGERRIGTDLLLAYSPERIDPGSTTFDLRSIPKVVGGVDAASAEAAVAFYRHLVDQVHPVSSPRAAELAKLHENTFRMVNIALVNELAMLCAEQGLDPWEVIAAAETKPFGFMPFYPGPGVGGHCIPIDPRYLTWQSRRDTGRAYRLVELAQDINAEMPAWVTNRIADALNDVGRAVRGSRIVALGVTYKPDVGDLRESAAVQVMEQLARRGAVMAFHDPFIASLDRPGLRLERAELDDALLGDADLVALLTPHAVYDLVHLTDTARLVFDARGAIGAGHPNVVVL